MDARSWRFRAFITCSIMRNSAPTTAIRSIQHQQTDRQICEKSDNVICQISMRVLSMSMSEKLRSTVARTERRDALTVLIHPPGAQTSITRSAYALWCAESGIFGVFAAVVWMNRVVLTPLTVALLSARLLSTNASALRLKGAGRTRPHRVKRGGANAATTR